MRMVFLILLLYPITFLVQAQHVEGEITSSADSQPIEGVHILNRTSHNMAISDEYGRFSIIADQGDTLIVSNINFNSKQFIFNEEKFLKITLNPAVIQLEEVRVSNMPETEADFRNKIIDMGEIEDDSFVPFGMKPNKPMGKVPKNYDPNYTNSLGYAINKPISFLVKKISKSHKNKVKYYQKVANQGNAIANNKKFNPEIVEELTGLKNDELTDFIQYLDLDPAFIQRSTEYEIAARILEEFDNFKIQKG